MEVIPNLDSEIVVVDSAPAIWGSSYGSEHTTIVLLVRATYFYSIAAVNLLYRLCAFIFVFSFGLFPRIIAWGRMVDW